MKKLTNYKQGEKGGYGGCMVWLIPLIAILLISCTRKLHTEKTETKSSDTESSEVKALKTQLKTLSDAYESVLASSNSSDVIVSSCPPCPGVGMAAMPHALSEVTVHPDGSKTIKGEQIKYKDKAETLQRISELQEENSFLKAALTTKDTSHHEQSHIEIIRTVKSTFIPIWLWVVLAIVGALWMNERFSIFKIPFITRTSLFKSNKQKTSL